MECHKPSKFHRDTNDVKALLCLLEGKRYMVFGTFNAFYPAKGVYIDPATLKRITPSNGDVVLLFRDKAVCTIFLKTLKKLNIPAIDYKYPIMDLIMGIFLGYRIHDIYHYYCKGVTSDIFYYEKLNNNPRAGELAKRHCSRLKAPSTEKWNELGDQMLQATTLMYSFSKKTVYEHKFYLLQSVFNILITGSS